MTSQIARSRPHTWVWRFARIAVRTFYRVNRVGPELPSGALLLVANHLNALLDPAVVQATANHQVRFLSNLTLFRNHPLSLFVRHSGAIPVYRRNRPRRRFEAQRRDVQRRRGHARRRRGDLSVS